VETIIADFVSHAPAIIDRRQTAVPQGSPSPIADAILAGVHALAE